MILCSKLKNGLCKIVTKSLVVTKFNVTKSRLHCILSETPSFDGPHGMIVDSGIVEER